jgi:hypothetical protein
MGTRTDIAERNVAEQRQRISRLLSDFEHRASEDVQAASHRVGERASEMQHRAGNALDSLPGKHVLDEQVPKHPLTSVMTGFGAGVVVGMLSGGSSAGNGGARHDWDGNRSSRERERGSDGGILDALSAAAVTTIAAPIQQELKDIAKQAVDGFLGKDSRASTAQASAESSSPPTQLPADHAEGPREGLQETKQAP